MAEVMFGTSQLSPSGIPVAVMAMPADRDACGHYRIFQPLIAMAKKHNVQVEIGTDNRRPYTVLVAQRAYADHIMETLDTVRDLSDKNKLPTGQTFPKIVYELDDDFWSIPESNPAHDLLSSEKVLRNIEFAIGTSHLVTVSTEPLAEVVSKWNDNVVVLPNCIPDYLLNENVYPYRTGQQDKPYVLGWAGSPTHRDDFKACASSVSTYLKLNPNTRMVFFGTDYSGMLDPSVRAQCMQAPWRKNIREYHHLLGSAQIDVMLAPLEANKFNESKSALRVLEANALGIPVIATRFGPYSSPHFTDGINGLSVPPGKTWISAINELSAPLTRLTISARAREYAAGFSATENAGLWLDTYKELLG